VFVAIDAERRRRHATLEILVDAAQRPTAASG